MEIYLSFISTSHSDFPLNLSSQHLKELDQVFNRAAGTVDITTLVPAKPLETRGSRPFDVEHGSEKELVTVTTTPIRSDTDTDAMFGAPSSGVDKLNLLDLKPRLPESVPIPDSFGPDVFDHAEESIKYMVLTNTWPRFVDTGYASGVKPENNSAFAWLQDRLRFGR